MRRFQFDKAIHCLVWNEYYDHATSPAVADTYPDGLHKEIERCLNADTRFKAESAVFADPDHGLTQERLDNTDVLFWWGHTVHHLVDDVVVNRVHERVNQGMGLVVLHSGHGSKIFHKLLGTRTIDLKWREEGEMERVWVVNPSHPVANGIGDHFDIPRTEMYGEPFMIPTPDELVFLSWYSGGELFRSGCVFNRGLGKIFYFSPGHETFPIYKQPEVQTILKNAAVYVAPKRPVSYVVGKYEPSDRIGRNG